MLLSRRALLASLAATSLLRTVRAEPGVPRRRFLFVYNFGGADPFSCLSPAWDRSGVQMPRDARLATSSQLDWVDTGVDGPRRYFDHWAGHSHVLHGMSIPSLAHEVCTEILFTGLIGAGRPDWPTMLTDARPDLPVPAFVLAGPSFAGPLGRRVARAGSDAQLQGLVQGTLRERSDAALPEFFPPGLSASIQRFARDGSARRAAALAGQPGGGLAEAWADTGGRALLLRDLLADLDLGAADDLPSQLTTATTLFARDIAQVVTVSSQRLNLWDTHNDNDFWQPRLNDELFGALDDLMSSLATTPGPAGGTLLDEVTVVYLTEMGRTPFYNSKEGRDHWPFATLMLAGAGVRTGASGGWSDNGQGVAVDLATGAPSDDGEVMTMEHLGATLLALAGLDAAAVLPFSPPITSVLA